MTQPEAPTVGYVPTPSTPDGLDGWYTSSVSLAWTVADPSSTGTLVPTGCVDQDITADQVATTYSCSATTIGGTTGPVDVSIKRDATPPTMTWLGGIADGASFFVGFVPAAPTITVADVTSGPAAGDVAGYSAACRDRTP